MTSTKQNLVNNRFFVDIKDSNIDSRLFRTFQDTPIVPLKEALKSVWKYYKNNQDEIMENADKYFEHEKSLNNDEKIAIHLYTMESNEYLYTALNSALRSNEKDSLNPWFPFLKLFLEGLFKLEKYSGYVYRGSSEDRFDHYQKGASFTWCEFASCTETIEDLEAISKVSKMKLKTVYRIECIGGRKISYHSTTRKEEILLFPGSEFQVRNKKRDDNGCSYIQLIQSSSTPWFSVSSIEPSVEREKKQGEIDHDWLDLQKTKEKFIVKPDEIFKTRSESVRHIEERTQRSRHFSKIFGSMAAMALGDALGAHVEFRPHEYMQAHPVKDLQGGGTWGLQPGQFTDDTSMALCLAASLIRTKEFMTYDQLVRYKWWYKYGYMSSTGKCFDIGNATRDSIEKFERRQGKLAKRLKMQDKEMDRIQSPDFLEKFDEYCSEDGVAGNGALMRLAPVPLFFYRDPVKAVEYSGISGQITHGDVRARDACRYYGALIVAALQGYSKNELLDDEFVKDHREWFGKEKLHDDILEIALGSYKNPDGHKGGIRGSGFIVRALEAALWAFWRDENSFEKGALLAVNLGDDTDTTAAIYGQLAGVFYGVEALPRKWVRQLYAVQFIESISFWLDYEGKNWSKRAQSPKESERQASKSATRKHPNKYEDNENQSSAQKAFVETDKKDSITKPKEGSTRDRQTRSDNDAGEDNESSSDHTTAPATVDVLKPQPGAKTQRGSEPDSNKNQGDGSRSHAQQATGAANRDVLPAAPRKAPQGAGQMDSNKNAGEDHQSSSHHSTAATTKAPPTKPTGGDANRANLQKGSKAKNHEDPPNETSVQNKLSETADSATPNDNFIKNSGNRDAEAKQKQSNARTGSEKSQSQVSSQDEHSQKADDLNGNQSKDMKKLGTKQATIQNSAVENKGKQTNQKWKNGSSGN